MKGNTETMTNDISTTDALDQPPLMVAESERTISGRVVPWGVAGKTSYGALEFPDGSVLSVPNDLSRVKLLDGHSPNGVPVGVATACECRDDGLYMSFKMGSSQHATDALLRAQEHVVDSFSIEAAGIRRSGQRVTSSLLKAVALVPFPAFSDARVAEVLASAVDDEPVDEDDTAVTSDNGENDPPASDTDTESDDTDKEDDDVNKPTNNGVLPAMNAPARTEEVHASYDDMLDYFTAAIRGDDTEIVKAELTDITASSMVNAAAPQWLGELWNGVTYTREIIPLLTTAPLRSMKATGYRWKTKPGVDTYAGDKTEIPSKGASVETVEVTAKRWAGGNDLDRKFWDFGERELLNAYWRHMAESYAFETDKDAGEFLVSNAVPVEDAAPDIVRAVARGSIHVHKALKTPATFAIINPEDLETVLSMNALDAPRYENLTPVANPQSWKMSEFVDKGTVIVGAKSAATHYELSGSPLRVEAEHIARGGRDAALFGYTALMLNKPGGIVKTTFSKPVLEA